MGWAGTITNQTTASSRHTRGGGMGWAGTRTNQTTASSRHYQHRPYKGWWDGIGWDNSKPNDSKRQTLATSTIGGVVGWDGLGQ